jgi:DNA-binding beta-propeller fold protein YncE
MIRRHPASVAALVWLILCIACGRGEPELTKVPIDGRPSAVAVAGGLVWVSDDGSQAVHVIDPARNAVVGPSIEVKRNPIAIAGSDDAVWVAHASGWLLRVDVRRRVVTERVHARASFTGVALLDGLVWATDVERGLYRLDPRDPEKARWVPLRGGAVRVLAEAPYLWVTGREDTVTRVDPRTGRTREYTVGLGPIGLASDGTRVWVANSDDGTVESVDGRVHSARGRVHSARGRVHSARGRVHSARGRVHKVGRGPVAIAFTAELMWVANQDDATVSLVEPDGRTKTIPIGIGPRGMASDGETVWIAGTNPEGVVRVEP